MKESIENMDAANRQLNAAQAEYIKARAAVVKAAVESGVKSRCVFIVGAVAWYVDPPGTCRSKYPDGWGVTWGEPPVSYD
jgi:hypothetical protein